MNKMELISAIKEAKGIVDEGGSKKASIDVRSIKVKIKELKVKHMDAKEAGNNKLADAFRRRISNLKKKTRRAA